MLVQRKMLPFRPLVAIAPAPLAGTSVQPAIRIVKQRRHHHTDTDWEDYKQTIFRLYIEEDRRADDVVEILARDFAFKASRRQIFKKLKEWEFEKNRKRRREVQGEDPGSRSRDSPVPEDTISRFAKRQITSALTAIASPVPTLPSINLFNSVRDHEGTAPGQSNLQAPPGTPSLLPRRDLLYMHASPGAERLEFSNIPLSMLDHTLDDLDLRTPRLSPNCEAPPLLLQTIHSPTWPQLAEPSTAIVVRTPSPTPVKVQLNNLPWFEFRVLYCNFLEKLGSMASYLKNNTSFRSKISVVDFYDPMADCHPFLNHATSSSEVPRCVSVMDGLRLLMPEESMNVRYLLDTLGEQHGTDLRFFGKSGFGPILDVLSSSWMSDSPMLNTEETIHTLCSYFKPFILERYNGELLEGAARILGPLYNGLLQFLSYTINLVSNNLLSDSNIDKIVQWIDEIQGYELLSKLLSNKSLTIHAFASNLLPSALRLKNVRFTRILLAAGVNPNSPVGYQIGPLAYAAQVGYVELVQILLAAGASVNARPSLHELTALQAASRNGNTEIVQILLDTGADVNAPPPKSISKCCTALQAAAESGNIKLVQVLIDAGADINAHPAKYFGYTALQAAAKSGNIEVVQVLLDAGADINAHPTKYFGYTALQAAAKSGNIEVVQVLLDAGADINAPPSECVGYTAIQAAAESGNIELVQILLSAGADINAHPAKYNGHTALQVAAGRGNIELVQVLLSAGANINAPPSLEGRTVIQAAAMSKNIKLVQILLSAGADINAHPAKHNGHTALQVAAGRGNIELVQILLSAGADINAHPAKYNGHTALQVAAGRGNIELVQVLLSASADINAPPSEHSGRTALAAAAAAERGNIELVQVLLDAGADINAPPSEKFGRTALQAAAERGNIELVEILLHAGAEVNAPPSECSGRTALQAAAQRGNIELVEILLNAGAEVNAPPSHEFGITAIQAAAIGGYIRIAQLLLDAGADVNAAPAVREGRTALEGAAEHGRIDMLQLLINYGAHTDSPHCERALELAAEYGHDTVCALLQRCRKGGRISPVKAR